MADGSAAKALAPLPENQGLIPSTYIVAHYYLSLQSQGLQHLLWPL